MPTVNIEMVPVIHDLFYQNPGMRYYVISGGRGKGATWSIARYLVQQALSNECFILCAREVQTSIANSSKKTIEDTIKNLGLINYFTFQKQETICNLTGARFIYHGISDMTNRSIKGLEAVDYAWVAESQNISNKSLKYLLPTIRKDDSCLIFDFNPESEDDPVYDRFIKNKNKVTRLALCECSWRDNPWFTKELEEIRQDDYNILPIEDYNWIWEGHLRKYTDAQIFAGCYSVEDFKDDVPQSLRNYLYGIDWGYANDPTTAVRAFVYEGYLFIEKACGQVKLSLTNTPELFDSVFHSRSAYAKADSARPETIEYMNTNHGFRIIAAKKGANSIGDGILRLKRFNNIIIDPSCTEVIREFDKYSWKINKQTEEIIATPEDKFNHYIDALRYATEDVDKRSGTVKLGKKRKDTRVRH